MAPPSFDHLPVGGRRLDDDGDRRQPTPAETLVEIVRQHFGHERRLIDPFDRRVGLVDDVEIDRRVDQMGRAQVEPPSQPLSPLPLRTEPRQHVAFRQSPEGPQRGQPQAPQHLHQLGTAEGVDRKRGEELRGLTDVDHDRRPDTRRSPVTRRSTRLARRSRVTIEFRSGPRGEGGTKGSVGDPDPHGRRQDELATHHSGHLLCQWAVAAEIPGGATARKQTRTGPGDLDSRGDVVERGDDRFVGPRLAFGVAVEKFGPWAQPLRLATAHSGHHPQSPGQRVGGDHPIRPHDHHRAAIAAFHRHGRPVGAPHDDRACRLIGNCHDGSSPRCPKPPIRRRSGCLRRRR